MKRPSTGFWILLASYAVCLLLLLPRLSLTLDEILDALTVHGKNWSQLIEAIPRNAGGVPLSYFARWGSIHLFGESSFSVRFPSALFSLAACPGIYLLARRFGSRWPLLAMVVFAILPLQFRYALEGRAYSQALCVSVWASVLFFYWLDQPTSRGRALLYGLCVTAGLYTQPYSFFVPLAHFLWLGLNTMLRKTTELPLPRGRGSVSLHQQAIVIGLSAFAFVPWYLYGSRLWSDQPVTSIGWRSVLLILHEISGAGYFGTAVLVCGIVLGFRSKFIQKSSFWALYLAIPIVGALIADALFVYFLAIRQMIFVLAPIAVLFAAGVEYLFERQRAVGLLLLATLAVTAVYEDAHFFWRPRENWEAATRILVEKTKDRSCILFAPQESVDLYAYFDPGVRSKTCTIESSVSSDFVAIAVSPYDGNTAENYVTHRREVENTKWVKVEELNPVGPRIELYRRTSSGN